MKVSKEGLRLIKDSEGLRLQSYLCPAGKWTIGYGSTKGVLPNMKITAVEAENLLKRDVAVFEKAINDLVKVPLTQSQFDALVSFTFNVGAGAFKKSTMLKLLNQGQYDRVPNEFSKWIYVGKKKSNGLIARRAKEAALFVNDDWNTDEAPMPNGNIKRATPSVMNKENLSFGAGIAGSVATAASELSVNAQPIQYALAAIMVIGFCAGLWFFIKRRGA